MVENPDLIASITPHHHHNHHRRIIIMSDLPPPLTTTSPDRRQPTPNPHHTSDHLTTSTSTHPLPPSMIQQFHQTQPQPSSSSSSGNTPPTTSSPHLHSRSILIDSPSLGSTPTSHPLSNPSGGAGGESTSFIPDTQRVTRAFGLRVIRTVRRGQLPFLLVFFT